MAAPSESPVGSAGRDIQLDSATLRVLAHPLRLNAITILRQRGPSTATLIAGQLGINPAATSYHLRRLAAGGLITEE
ncbi:winged helix-turn-helix domain-containing protein, partial [Streptomyces sp900116325]|uniref:ArsR/SmtB family transcription factor n=1 Tax=Streptomyces sp. 900116325 TaxID=3154295 RepID=UPI0033E52861